MPSSGWLLTGAAVLVGTLLLVSVRRARPVPGAAAAPEDLACRELVELVTDLLDGVLPAAWRDGVESHLADCDGCAEYVRQIRTTIEALGRGPGHPAAAAARDAPGGGREVPG